MPKRSGFVDCCYEMAIFYPPLDQTNYRCASPLSVHSDYASKQIKVSEVVQFLLTL